ncbi:MAG: transglycosylase SLT domain-containing protein [Piscinibacter sp.]|uniref:lytic transglycosylase domain-containing protein n=1 Tax=Piscinibacter TaxID=1114981 RepID=UPI000FDF43ED|nr:MULTISPECIES: transglycosylase SLT domain-containing protein [Piscinibacter]MCW5667626.1 transglycosylase SLT domain-containing protein [Piscinibacter sp.]
MGAGLLAALVLVTLPAARAADGDNLIVDAREAWRRKDGPKLATLRSAANALRHPLAMWVDYWELNNRLAQAQQDELNAFYARWSGTYVEDRLRNDWLLELGRRRDWANFAVDQPRFRMNDDREVSCYALLIQHQAGKDVREAALSAWLAQRDADEGCGLLAQTLVEARRFGALEVWRKARVAMDAGRPRAVRQAVALLSPGLATSLGEITDNPARYLAKSASAAQRTAAELTTLALLRMAANDPDAAAAQLNERWERALPPDLAAWAWAGVGKQAALKLLPDASDHFRRAELRAGRGDAEPDWPDEMLAWKVRAALRADGGRPRWQQVVKAINAMSAAEQRDLAWVYWKARGLKALAASSQDGEGMAALAQDMLAGISGPLSFYAKLAAEEIGDPLVLPPKPAALTEAEVAAAEQHPGLTRALQLIALGLRSEGVREWNYSLRGMGDRELLAAAQRACDREVWDRCINTSDRTRGEIDLEQRFPTPFRRDVQSHAREIGLDPAYVYGLIRQESRFVMDARSSVGASGLMQIMPATARWTARKIGMDFTAEQITDRDTNLRLGTSYLKLVLDDFEGSQAMAAAAYNAGPSRPRRWREGPVLEPAAWAENIPFNETRDYVKKVLSNAAIYAALLGSEPAPSLKARLGRSIGPREGPAPAIDKELP